MIRYSKRVGSLYELQEIVSSNGNIGSNVGELEPTTMSMCIKEGSNTIRQVQWEEIEEVNKWFETLMGEDLQTRKEYIKDNLHKYKMED